MSYWEDPGFEKVKDWIIDTKGRDLIVDYEFFHGHEHNVVVVFQEDNKNLFEHNMCMRATYFLIVVNIPKCQFESFCFCP